MKKVFFLILTALMAAACHTRDPFFAPEDGGGQIFDGGLTWPDGGPADGGETDGGEEPFPDPVIRVEVDSISPQLGHVAGGTEIAVRGRGFVAGTRASLAGRPLTSIRMRGEHTLIGQTPPGSPGPAGLIITNTAGLTMVENAFVYYDNVRLNSVDPDRSPTVGGQTMVLRGTGFIGGTRVTVGGRQSPLVHVINATTIHAVTPPGQAGRVAVRVTNQYGSANLPNAMTYYVPLKIISIIPAAGPVAGGNKVVITANALSPNALVSFGGTAVTTQNSLGPSRLEVTVPPSNSAIAVDVTVNDLNGTGTRGQAYTYLDPASLVLAMAPTRGPTTGGILLTVTGSGFQTGAPSVSIGGAACGTVSVLANSVLTCVLPSGVAGSAEVKVTVNGVTTTLNEQFTYYRPLKVTTVAPTSGPVAGGTAVTVTGEGFHQGIKVYFGALQATNINVLDGTSLKASTPRGSAGAVDIVISDPDSWGILPAGFTYEESPELLSITPTQGAKAGGTFVELRGNGFASGMAITFGGSPAMDIFVSDQAYATARTPAGGAGTVDVSVSTNYGTATLRDAYRYFDPASYYGGTWGGPIRGAVNVTVLAPGVGGLAEAYVTLSTGDHPTPYSGLTDENGQITFSGPDVYGRQTVSAAAEGFEASSIVAFDAENVTLILSQNVGEGGGEPPPGPPKGLVSGIITPDHKQVPEPGPNEQKVALIYSTSENIFNLGIYDMRIIPDSGADTFPYTLVTRTGDLAVVAITGIWNTSTGEFTQYYMGLKRYLNVSENQMVAGADIRVNKSLNAKITMELEDIPFIDQPTASNFVTPYLVLGADGVVNFFGALRDEGLGLTPIQLMGTPEVSPFESTFSVNRVPQLDGPLADATYSLTTGTVGDVENTNYVPLVEHFVHGVDNISQPVHVGPLLSIPTMESPVQGYCARDECHHLKWFYVSGAQPTFVTLLIYEPQMFGIKRLWNITLAGDVMEFNMPDITSITGISTLSDDFNVLIIQPALKSSFSIDSFDLTDFSVSSYQALSAEGIYFYYQ